MRGPVGGGGRAGAGAWFRTGLLLSGLAGCAAPGSGASVSTGGADDAPPYAFDVAEEAGVPRTCIAHVMALPLLTRNGNPAVAVAVDGVPGAAFLAPSQAVLGVYETRALVLPAQGHLVVSSITGPGEVPVVGIDRLQVAQGHAAGISALDLGPAGPLRVAGRRPLAVLGSDVLGEYDLLLDMPRQRAMLFRPSGAPGCPPLSDWLHGAHRAALEADGNGARDAVTVALDSRPLRLLLEPAADGSVIGADAAREAGLRLDADADSRVRTEASAVMVGVRHRFASVRIGDWTGRDFAAGVEPARYGVLGLPFFRHRAVILGFADGLLLFDDPHPDRLPPDDRPPEPGPVSTRVAEASAASR